MVDPYVIIKINGVRIKTPTSYKISRYNLTKSGRVASGDMTMELVAKKRKLFLTYEVLSGEELQHILDLIDGDALFFTVSYTENNQTKSMTAYVGEIPTDLYRPGSKWYWNNVSFNLIER